MGPACSLGLRPAGPPGSHAKGGGGAEEGGGPSGRAAALGLPTGLRTGGPHTPSVWAWPPPSLPPAAPGPPPAPRVTAHPTGPTPAPPPGSFPVSAQTQPDPTSPPRSDLSSAEDRPSASAAPDTTHLWLVSGGASAGLGASFRGWVSDEVGPRRRLLGLQAAAAPGQRRTWSHLWGA